MREEKRWEVSYSESHSRRDLERTEDDRCRRRRVCTVWQIERGVGLHQIQFGDPSRPDQLRQAPSC